MSGRYKIYAVHRPRRHFWPRGIVRIIVSFSYLRLSDPFVASLSQCLRPVPIPRRFEVKLRGLVAFLPYITYTKIPCSRISIPDSSHCYLTLFVLSHRHVKYFIRRNRKPPAWVFSRKLRIGQCLLNSTRVQLSHLLQPS